MTNAFPRRAAVAVSIATCVALSTALSALPGNAEPNDGRVPVPDGPVKVERRAAVPREGGSGPDSKVSPRLRMDANKTHGVFVQLSGRSAAQVNVEAIDNGRSRAATAEATRDRRSEVRRNATTVAAAARKADRDAKQLFSVANGMPGVAVRTDAAGIKAMAQRSDVLRITPLTRYHLENASAAQLTQTLKTWQDTGLTGKGVRLGVIDTGIDYTHADFGGPGTTDAFEAADRADTQPGWETAKVVGGWDFVGDDYNSADDNSAVPVPDPNPLDCEGHGTHVAGTAAGFGVDADGKTFRGNYRKLNAATLNEMRIGPGTAPQASLFALRVFGCEGSTDVIMPALDWALDPNGDGDFSDRLDVINMSLGADYDAPDDPENTLIDQLAVHGVMTVNSAGNAADYTDAGSAARRALTVASSVDSFNLLDGLRVDAPAPVAGQVGGQVSQAYPWATENDRSGAVVTLPGANADGCRALSPSDRAKVAGKVAWLEWDDDAATRRCGSAARSANVRNAGGIGALFTSELPEFDAGITGDAQIPVFQLNRDGTAKLRPAAEAGTLRVTFTGSLLASIKTYTPSLVDTLSSFSSRGTHGQPGTVKPDLAAPGQSIASAKVASGNEVASNSGTSMASPHVAGIAALLRSKYPTWPVERIKAAIMNTAVHDIYTEPSKKGRKYGPARVGAGRVDAKYAATTPVIAYSKSDPGVVSASFGVVEAPITSSTVRKTKSITLRNVSSSTRTVSLSYSAAVKQDGVSYSVSPRSVRLKAKATRTVTVTMTIKTKQLRRTIDPTMSPTTVTPLAGEGNRQFVSDASGRLLVKPSGKTALRVPVYGAAKPVSVTHASVAPGVVTLKGKGVNQGSGSRAYQSKASLLTLGATSRKLPSCVLGQTTECALNATARSSDLRYTGAGYVPDTPGQSPGEGWLWFGVTMWGNAPHLVGVETYVDIDVNGDGKVDYWILAFTPADSDQPLAVLVDPNADPDDNVVSVSRINFLNGASDTNSFDNDSFLIPVRAGDIGVQPDATTYPIHYRTSTWNPYGPVGALFDSTSWVSFDVVKPRIATDSPLYLDRNGQRIPYTVNAPGTPVAKTTRANAAAATPTAQALLIHLGARSGSRAEVLTVR